MIILHKSCQHNTNNSNQNSHQADNHHCQPCDTPQTFDNLFCVDCPIDDQHCVNDLQRFPVTTVDPAKEEKEEKEESEIDLAPTTIAVAGHQVNDQHKGKVCCKTLLDSGSTNDAATRNALPKDVWLFDLQTPIIIDTGNGPCACTKCVCLHCDMFPELSLTRKCKWMKCAVNG